MRSCGLLFCAVLLITLGLGAQLPGPASAADLDCADFSSQAEAQENLLPGDPYGLDGDSDGIACEDNPCPCGSATAGGGESQPSVPAPPPPPPPYRLSMGAAKAEAKRIARRFVRPQCRRQQACLRRLPAARDQVHQLPPDRPRQHSPAANDLQSEGDRAGEEPPSRRAPRVDPVPDRIPPAPDLCEGEAGDAGSGKSDRRQASLGLPHPHQPARIRGAGRMGPSRPSARQARKLLTRTVC